MRRVTYAGEALMTGSAVAEALLDYAQYVIRAETSVSVSVPVLEQNGVVVDRTILLGPATQLESRYADGIVGDEEARRFPVPAFPPVGGKGMPADIEPLPEYPQT
ncbi:MAG TPA: hypothetical protein VN619_04015 [Lacisediminihabitans sp.]|jgi:hypothetical protein|nr:hypothetical protein [Lacisediminihabitans sp.]HXD61075.1 hypothetical protein [Lacisediminihabitans sp.]